MIEWLPFLVTALAQNPIAPYAVDGPLSEPRLFGEGVISTSEDELNASFTPEGNTVYFTKNHFGKRLGIIVLSWYSNGNWSEPEVAPFSGRYTDYDPFVSPDGGKLYFVSNRPLEGTKPKDFDVWVVEKTGMGGWSEPSNLSAPVNTDQDEFYPSVAADGTLYISANRPEGKGRFDVYRSRWEDGKFATPENLGDGVNTAFNEIDNWVSPDQSVLVFASSGRPDDLGGGDLYVSRNVDGTWTPARHLEAPINSSAREYCPIGSPDGRYFFFTSFRGFGDEIPSRPISYRELREGLSRVTNGWGNVYQVDLSRLTGK